MVQHALRLSTAATEQCARLIATASLHHSRVVRHAACSIAAHCVKQAVPLAGQFIAVFQEVLRQAPDIPVWLHPSNVQCKGLIACQLIELLFPGCLAWCAAWDEPVVSRIALMHSLRMACNHLQAAVPTVNPADEEGLPPVALSERLQTALHSIAPAPDDGISPLDPQDAARFLLAGHHPTVTMARARPGTVWYAPCLDSYKVVSLYCTMRLYIPREG